MKVRPALLAFAVLLLTGSFANASSGASANAPTSPADGKLAMMPADGSLGCPNDELAFLNPAPSDRATGPCGPCSATNCQGAQIGQYCGYSGGSYYTCQYPYALSCTDGSWKCYCWTGPIP